MPDKPPLGLIISKEALVMRLKTQIELLSEISKIRSWQLSVPMQACVYFWNHQ